MGLGPAFAIEKVLRRNGMGLKEIQLFEINEAFAVQVLACQEALASKSFAKEYFPGGQPVGEIDPALLNVNGGGIALGHPVGVSGARLILTCLKEMKRRGLRLGLASLCIGGGQGGVVLLERNV
jgi:acetyl-CoA acetyltransferase